MNCVADLSVKVILISFFSFTNKLRTSNVFQELSAALCSETGKLYPLKCEIIREADIKEAFRWIKWNLGGVDILVNNAGVASDNSLMGEQP